MANQQTLQGSWNEISGKIRSKWGQLSQDDLQQFKGSSDQLVGFIQRKTGESRDKIESFLDDITERGASAGNRMMETARDYASQAMDSVGANMESVREGAEQVADRVRRGYETASEMVHDRPGSAVAAAFGAGLVAGVLIAMMLRGKA